MKDLFYLYCKQRELEGWWPFPWACGFASLVTCFRLLGDRSTEGHELVEQFKQGGGQPKNGMTTDDAVGLARQFGYRAARNPNGSSRRSKPAFLQWMLGKWAKGQPVMLSVDTSCAQDIASHWWVVFGDPDAEAAWVMDPYCKNVPFACQTHREILAAASCNDGAGFVEFDAVAISAPTSKGLPGIPPSATLMEFLNQNVVYRTGWTSQGIAAALVDNHLRGIGDLPSLGRATGRGSVLVSDLLAKSADVVEIIEKWGVFFSTDQEAGMAELIAVLADLEAHKCHRVTDRERDQMTMDIALNVILIATTLMDD